MQENVEFVYRKKPSLIKISRTPGNQNKVKKVSFFLFWLCLKPPFSPIRLRGFRGIFLPKKENSYNPGSLEQDYTFGPPLPPSKNSAAVVNSVYFSDVSSPDSDVHDFWFVCIAFALG